MFVDDGLAMTWSPFGMLLLIDQPPAREIVPVARKHCHQYPRASVTEWLELIPVIALEIGAAFAMVLVQALAGVPRGQQITSVIALDADSRA
jgi:hypothetical protein